jgi:hypothetical protein
MNKLATLLFFFVTAMLACAGNLTAQWSSDPTVNTVVSVGHLTSENPCMAVDANGGVYIVWDDGQSGGKHSIFAQHFDGAGNALWGQGDSVCVTDSGYQTLPTVCSDDSGGMYIAWEDHRLNSQTTYDIYAQHINSAGVTEWVRNGINVTNNSGFAYATAPHAVPDQKGGFLVVYFETALYAYCARLNGAGTVLWNQTVSTGLLSTTVPSVCATGDGGAIVAFQDQNAYFTTFDIANITAQRFDSTGVRLWGAGGLPVCTAPKLQNNPVVVADGNGGAIVAWEDFRDSTTYYVYAQHLSSAGVRTWVNGSDSNGVRVTNLTQSEQTISMAATSSHGAILTWNDGSETVYVQKINSSGAAQWGAGGFQVTNESPAVAENAQLVNDGSDGAYVTWDDSRHTGADYDIYAQHINANGSAAWAANGAPVSTAEYNQMNPIIVLDPKGGAIVTWLDFRYYPSNLFNDLYAQRINNVGTLTGVKKTSSVVPKTFALAQNFPNPFNPTTIINYDLPKEAFVRLVVYNILGQEIRTLVNETEEPGAKSVQFDGNNFPSGMYFYRITAGAFTDVKRMVLVK